MFNFRNGHNGLHRVLNSKDHASETFPICFYTALGLTCLYLLLLLIIKIKQAIKKSASATIAPEKYINNECPQAPTAATPGETPKNKIPQGVSLENYNSRNKKAYHNSVGSAVEVVNGRPKVPGMAVDTSEGAVENGIFGNNCEVPQSSTRNFVIPNPVPVVDTLEPKPENLSCCAQYLVLVHGTNNNRKTTLCFVFA